MITCAWKRTFLWGATTSRGTTHDMSKENMLHVLQSEPVEYPNMPPTVITLTYNPNPMRFSVHGPMPAQFHSCSCPKELGHHCVLSTTYMHNSARSPLPYYKPT